jgi:DNA invertase Pin-like site-specific DNA recombinase
LYRDAGFSGENTKRSKLEELMRDIEVKKLDIILVTKLDRITRSISDLEKLLQFFDKHNVKGVLS